MIHRTHKAVLITAVLLCGSLCVVPTGANPTDPTIKDPAIDAQKITFPNILAQKRILTKDIVAGDRVEVELSLFNIGAVPAQDIVVEENEWDPAIVMEKGEFKHQLARLGIYESVKINYYIRVPNEEGEFRGGPAKITYRREEAHVQEAAEETSAELDETLAPTDTKVHVSYSTQIYEDAELPYDRMSREDTAPRPAGNGPTSTAGKLRVLSQKAFDQRNAHHIKEVALFLVLLLVPIGLPYYFYYMRSKELALALSTAAAAASSPTKKSH